MPQSKRTWKSIYLFFNALSTLAVVAYIASVIWLAPKLNAEFDLFSTAESWKWIFPIVSIPVIMYIYYLIESLRDDIMSKSMISISMLVLGLIYLVVLLLIIIFNIVTWVQHCTSGSSEIYAYCYSAGALTDEFEFAFWASVVHALTYIIMLALAWYTISEGMFETVVSGVKKQYPTSTYTQMESQKGSGHFA